MAAAGLDPERDFERLRPPARRRFLARARRAGQDGRLDLYAAADDAYQEAWLELQRRPDTVAIEHDPAVCGSGRDRVSADAVDVVSGCEIVS